jgi:hypothetical protein
MSESLLARVKSDAWARSVAFTWFKCLAVLGVICVVYETISPTYTITDFFLIRHDLPIGLSCLVLVALVALPAMRLPQAASDRLGAFVDRFGLWVVLAVALLVAAGALAGWWLVYQAYPLSMDEFWAVFDARVFGRGMALAPVAPQWRSFAPALEPMWRLDLPGNAAWASTYLPMNAALRALFGLLGSQALSGPFWAGLSIILTYALARDFWPDRRDVAFVAAILLATSSQVVVIAMSPYAMSAHLALNMGWLWLFRRPWSLSPPPASISIFSTRCSPRLSCCSCGGAGNGAWRPSTPPPMR